MVEVRTTVCVEGFWPGSLPRITVVSVVVSTSVCVCVTNLVGRGGGAGGVMLTTGGRSGGVLSSTEGLRGGGPSSSCGRRGGARYGGLA